MQRSTGSGCFCYEDDRPIYRGARRTHKKAGVSRLLSRSHEGHEETQRTFRFFVNLRALRDEDVSGSASSRRPCGPGKQRIAVEPGKRRRRLTMLRLGLLK